MTDQKHTKKIMVSTPSRHGKNYETVMEMFLAAQSGKICQFSTFDSEKCVVALPAKKYQVLLDQRDELREALEKCQSCSVFGDPPDYKNALLDLLHIASEAIRKYKG